MSLRDLRAFQIDPERGFLPAPDPLDVLPDTCAIWEETARALPTLRAAGRLRDTVDRWPPMDLDSLESHAQLERAMLLLSFIGNAYVWESSPAASIPAALAGPWCQAAERLDRPPIASHASLVLQNWRRLDPEGEIELGNLATQTLAFGGTDEQWFYLVTVAIEAAGAPSLRILSAVHESRAHDRSDGVAKGLEALVPVLDALSPLLERMWERCDPYVFYHRVRPILTGWPEPGLVYEGVDEEPKLYAGGSAAQSSLLQAIDAALGIRHHGASSGPFLLKMRRYMPRGHRAFIEALEAEPSLRAYVQELASTHPTLGDLFNRAVRAVARFRETHYEIVRDYISRQAESSGGMALGTGGTAYGHFLSRTKNETEQARVGGSEAPTTR
jgi:indoleamine 2,3-dioxygenase